MNTDCVLLMPPRALCLWCIENKHNNEYAFLGHHVHGNTDICPVSPVVLFHNYFSTQWPRQSHLILFMDEEAVPCLLTSKIYILFYNCICVFVCVCVCIEFHCICLPLSRLDWRLVLIFDAPVQGSGWTGREPLTAQLLKEIWTFSSAFIFLQFFKSF